MLLYIQVLVLEYPIVKLAGLDEILPSKSSDVKNFIQQHDNNGPTLDAISSSRQCYQGFSPLHIRCTPYSNWMFHSGNSAYQGLNWLFWNLNRVIIQQHDNNKHYDNDQMAQLRMSFSLSRKWYQVLPPLRIHCTPNSNCMCHVSNGPYQGLNELFWDPVVVVVCRCRFCFFSFWAAPDLQNYIVLHYTTYTYNNFNTGSGTVTVGGKFDNHVCRLRGPQV